LPPAFPSQKQPFRTSGHAIPAPAFGSAIGGGPTMLTALLTLYSELVRG